MVINLKRKKTGSYSSRSIVTKEFDWLLFIVTIITAAIGIVIIYSATRTTGSDSNVIVQSVSCCM